ncbi:MAG: Na+/H+ antiporter NhaC family protein [Saprospiraceae bacterium]
MVTKVAGATIWIFNSAYKVSLTALTTKTQIETSNAELNDLFAAKGMEGMLSTIWLILCAMVFGGVMDAIGALSRISKALLQMFQTVFGLFASTVLSCLTINVSASDQYLAIVITGRCVQKKAFDEKGLHPVNLSRTLEDGYRHIFCFDTLEYLWRLQCWCGSTYSRLYDVCHFQLDQ